MRGSEYMAVHTSREGLPWFQHNGSVQWCSGTCRVQPASAFFWPPFRALLAQRGGHPAKKLCQASGHPKLARVPGGAIQRPAQ